MTESLNPNPAEIEADSSERQFVENLLNQRANFALVVFGLALAGAATLNERLSQVLVLVASTWLAILLAMATSRAQWKLDIILANLDASHPAKRSDAGTKADSKDFDRNRKLVPAGMWLLVNGSRRGLVGYAVPWSIVAMLVTAAVLAGFGFLVRPDDRLVTLQAEVRANRVNSTRALEATASKLDSLAAELKTLKDAVVEMQRLRKPADSLPPRAGR